MAAAKRKSIAKLCLALGLFVLAGFFRQADRVGAPLPSAAFFLLTNLIYIGLAMGWGFSISRRILHRCDRRWLLLGCAMTVLWLFLRTVKYRFFNDDTVTRYLWYLYYVPQILAPLFSLFAALQLGRRDGDTFSLRWYLLFLPAICLIGGVLTNDLHQMAFRAAPALQRYHPTIFTAGCTISSWRGLSFCCWQPGLLSIASAACLKAGDTHGCHSVYFWADLRCAR